MNAGEMLAETLRTARRNEKLLQQILAAMASTEAPKTATGGAVASDADLDGEHGDPMIRKDPPKWEGASFVGSTYSQCSPEYLDSLAGFLEWKAGKDTEKAAIAPDEETRKKSLKYAHFGRLDAGRARGWAARMRRPGWSGAVQSSEPSADDMEIPF